MTTVKLYGIPNCDSVKKGRAWLADQGHEVVFHDFKKQGVPVAELDAWLKSLGWQALINRKGTTWRKLPEHDQAGVVDDASARALALANASVIKRPVVMWPDGRITVGLPALMA